MSHNPETTRAETTIPVGNHAAIHTASELAVGATVSPLYHEQSTRIGARSQFYTGPRQTYDRSLLQYESGINELSSDGKPLFNIDDWVGKTMVDIGSGGYDRAGMGARRKG